MSRLIPQPDHHNRFTNWKHLDKHDLYARAGRMSVNPGARRPKVRSNRHAHPSTAEPASERQASCAPARKSRLVSRKPELESGRVTFD
jgi:hypothetical protein